MDHHQRLTGVAIVRHAALLGNHYDILLARFRDHRPLEYTDLCLGRPFPITRGWLVEKERPGCGPWWCSLALPWKYFFQTLMIEVTKNPELLPESGEIPQPTYFSKK